MKYAVAPLALLLGLGLAACGSDDSSDAGPDAASQGSSTGSDPSAEAGASSAFCEALLSTAQLEDGQDVAELRETLEDSGIPEEAGEDAEQGLQVYLDVLGQVDEDATAEDLADLEDPGLSKEEQSQVDAMVQYATGTCTAGPGQNSQSPESPESPEE